MSIIHENMPALEDGCSARSWKCQNPNKDDMEKGRVDGTSIIDVRKECKRCPVCMMVLCEHHMSTSNHMKDCNFRSNQERQLLEEQRAIESKKKSEMVKKLSKEAKDQADFVEKEKLRRKVIAERNAKLKNGR